jgi:hypothetical protein
MGGQMAQVSTCPFLPFSLHTDPFLQLFQGQEPFPTPLLTPVTTCLIFPPLSHRLLLPPYSGYPSLPPASFPPFQHSSPLQVDPR